MSAWQPIETAPKNGGAILVWVASIERVFCAVWREDEEYPWSGGWAIFGGDHRQFLRKATHWMPLPEPPEPES
jgi:hypothetical protein